MGGGRVRFPGSRNYRPHLMAPHHDPLPKKRVGCYSCGKVAGVDLKTMSCASCGLPQDLATKRQGKRWRNIRHHRGTMSKRVLKHGRITGRKVYKRG